MITRQDLDRMVGQVLRVRWRHNPGFGRDVRVYEGFGIVRKSRDVGVTSPLRKYDDYLRKEDLGITWEAVQVNVTWKWPGGEGS